MKVMRFDGRHNITGQQIREIRLAKKLTQDQIVARLQVEGIQINQKAISRIESGDRIVSDFELVYLAKALGVLVTDLFPRDQ